MEPSLHEGFTVFARPACERRKLHTSNLLVALNKELRRRNRLATRFPSEGSLLRLVTAALIRLGDDWQTGRIGPPPESG